MKKYGKLVRDLFLERIRAKDEPYIAHIAESDEEYEAKLLDKLIEEVGEFVRNESPEEMADLFEVVKAIEVLHPEFNRQAIEMAITLTPEYDGEELDNPDVQFDVQMQLVEAAQRFDGSRTEATFVNFLLALEAARSFYGFGLNTLEALRLTKLETHGGFEKRIILDES